MASKVDWKQKYHELRSKYMQAIDVAFRLGVQEGQKAAEVQMLQQQLQEMQQAAMMAAQGGMPGQEMPPEEMPPEEMPPEEMPPEEMPPEEMPPEEAMAAEEGGDELGQSIEELEGLVAKNEKKEFDFTSILKKFHQFDKEENLQKDESKAKKQDKINKILKKWDEDGSEETDEEDVLGQA